MAASSYDEALTRLLAHEGGYSNHPSDPGGPTRFGITIHDYRMYVNAAGTADDVRTMPIDIAKRIYRQKYWNAQRCDELPGGVDYAVFDYGVNSGIGRSGKVLRRILGFPDQVGSINDDVIAAAEKRNASVLVNAICDERLAFLQGLRTWPTFGNGWGRRVKEVRAVALAMAKAFAPPAREPAKPKPSTVPDVVVTTVIVGTGAGSAHALGIPIEFIAIGAAVAVAIAVFLIIRNRRK